MTKLKLLVTGNCQARPVATLLEATGHFECLPPIILQLAKTTEKEAHLFRISEADVVLAQNTNDNFPVPHLRSSVLRQSHSNVLIWPNVFFSGQQPFIRYMTHIATASRLVGPIEALHDLRIFSRWLYSRGLIKQPWQPDESTFSRTVADRSIADLMTREADCDIMISDFIAEHARTERLFFTFNHPSRRVLNELCNRFMAHQNLAYLPDGTAEYLDRYLVPSHWGNECLATYRGNDFTLGDEGTVTALGTERLYSPDELQAAFFEVYDHNPLYRDMESIRLTPQFAGDLE
ncbi:hypothetical protein ROSMUCSMR3_03402 [Roseovarius mucosus]|uniref:Polysaccharide biosynthesis enzyme WcbI domain-containing protein n=1 Tax=Roseovarius mucosus TaxID=215743 RepID=A0A1V0RSX1_9RHOB|nr:WcbI family polysaccharide biosynthesis putative acetyltransferase [Roseovarius mucosus]ARE84863.1 hypothetical protein ROSMUCSMR3_03402 [Roseovarius mucosus]